MLVNIVEKLGSGGQVGRAAERRSPVSPLGAVPLKKCWRIRGTQSCGETSLGASLLKIRSVSRRGRTRVLPVKERRERPTALTPTAVHEAVRGQFQKDGSP